MGPFPSIGFPNASTTRPNISGPTGTSTMFPVRLTVSPSLISRSFPKMVIPTLSIFEFKKLTKNVPRHTSSKLNLRCQALSFWQAEMKSK